jgi:tetratricopeptide (TPR) repeat protein
MEKAGEHQEAPGAEGVDKTDQLKTEDHASTVTSDTNDKANELSDPTATSNTTEPAQNPTTAEEEKVESATPAAASKSAEELAKAAEEKKAREEEGQKLQAQKFQNFIEQAQKYKDEGNEFFKAGELQKARGKYTRVFAYTKSLVGGGPDGSDAMVDMALKASSKGEIDQDLKKKARELERDVNCNMAMVYLKERNWAKAVEKATNSLNIEKTTKAYFRRGKAYAMKNDFENAYKDFEEGKKLDDSDAKLFDEEIAKTKKREKEYDKQMSKKFNFGFNSK